MLQAPPVERQSQPSMAQPAASEKFCQKYTQSPSLPNVSLPPSAHDTSSSRVTHTTFDGKHGVSSTLGTRPSDLHSLLPDRHLMFPEVPQSTLDAAMEQQLRYEGDDVRSSTACKQMLGTERFPFTHQAELESTPEPLPQLLPELQPHAQAERQVELSPFSLLSDAQPLRAKERRKQARLARELNCNIQGIKEVQASAVVPHAGRTAFRIRAKRDRQSDARNGDGGAPPGTLAVMADCGAVGRGGATRTSSERGAPISSQTGVKKRSESSLLQLSPSITSTVRTGNDDTQRADRIAKVHHPLEANACARHPAKMSDSPARAGTREAEVSPSVMLATSKCASRSPATPLQVSSSATLLELQEFAEGLLQDSKINDADDRSNLALFSNARRVCKLSNNLSLSGSLIVRGVRGPDGALLGGIVLERTFSIAGSTSRGHEQVKLVSLLIHYEHQRRGLGKLLLLDALEESARRSAAGSPPSEAFVFSVDFGGCEASSWPFFNRILRMCTRRNGTDNVACHAVAPYECSSRDGGCGFKHGQGLIRKKSLGCMSTAPHLVIDLPE